MNHGNLAVNRRRDAFCDQAQEQLTQAFAHRLILLTIRGPTEGSHRIPPHPWFPNFAEVEARAYAAGEAAFTAVVEAELSRMG
jgi:hypothetical protein